MKTSSIHGPSPAIYTLLAVLCLTVVAFMFQGCGSTPQTTDFKTLSTIETTASGAYSGYLALVVKGQARTNEVPIISHSFNQLQADIVLAATVLQNGTNALAPDNIVTEAALLTTAITTAESIKP